jgi:hypothetical protein
MNDYVCGSQQAMDKVQKSVKSNYNVLSTEEVKSKGRRFVKIFVNRLHILLSVNVNDIRNMIDRL